MNERILKLYKTAQVPHTAIDPSNNMPYETTCFSPEKFAELIVQECNNRANQYISDCGEVASLPERILEEHFGVKG